MTLTECKWAVVEEGKCVIEDVPTAVPSGVVDAAVCNRMR